MSGLGYQASLVSFLYGSVENGQPDYTHHLWRLMLHVFCLKVKYKKKIKINK